MGQGGLRGRMLRAEAGAQHGNSMAGRGGGGGRNSGAAALRRQGAKGADQAAQAGADPNRLVTKGAEHDYADATGVSA